MEIAKTADQALVVLLWLADHGPQTPSEAAAGTGLNRTVVHRLLATLHGRGFVYRHGDQYGIGPAVVRLAERFLPALRAVAQPVMERFAEKLGETLALSVRDGDQVTLAAQVVPANGRLVHVAFPVDYRHPLTLGASGLALLAFLPDAEQQAVLARAADPGQVRRRITEARTLGYAITHDELRSGVYGIAVPVPGQHGTAFASLALVVPATRATALVGEADALSAAARDIATAVQS